MAKHQKYPQRATPESSQGVESITISLHKRPSQADPGRFEWQAELSLGGEVEHGEWHGERRWANADLAVFQKQWAAAIIGPDRTALG